MNAIKIKNLLIANNVKMVDIATNLSCSRGAVSSVIAHRHRSARIETAVANAIGVPVGEVFAPSLHTLQCPQCGEVFSP